MLHETEGREEDLQLLVLQHAAHWTLEGDAAEQLEALFKQETENKLSDPQADVLELCRERWREFKRTTRKDVVQQCDAYKDKTAKRCGICGSLKPTGCWRARPRPQKTARRSLLSPPKSRPVSAVRTVVGVPGVGHWGHFRRLGQC